MSTSFLSNLQSEIERKLNTEELFQDIPVIAHRQDDLNSCINEFVQTGTGLCILVMNPLPTRIIPGKDQVTFESMNIRVQVIDSGCLLNTEQSALAVAERITGVLHQFKPTIKSWSGWLQLSERNPWRELGDKQHLGRYILELTFNCKGSARHENQA